MGSPDGFSGPGPGIAVESSAAWILAFATSLFLFTHVQSQAREETAGAEFSTPISVYLAVYTFMLDGS